jgi:hypothetical protein
VDNKGNSLAGREITWSSSDAKVLAVAKDGTVTAKGDGSAKILAACEGKQAEALIKVVAPPPPPPPKVAPPPMPEPAAAEAATVILPTLKSRAAQTDAGEAGARAGTGRDARLLRRSPVRCSRSGASRLSRAGNRCLGLRRSGGPAGNGSLVRAPRSPPGAGRDRGRLPRSAPPRSPQSNCVGPMVRSHRAACCKLVALIKDDAGKELTGRPLAWTSSDLAVAEVAPNGAVTAHKTGTAMITATSEGKSATADGYRRGTGLCGADRRSRIDAARPDAECVGDRWDGGAACHATR